MSNTVFILLQFHEKSTRIFSHNMGKTKSWLFQAYLLLMYLYSFHFTKKVPAIFHTTWENTNLDSLMPTTTVFILLPFHEKSTRIFSHNMILYQNWPFLTLLSKKKKFKFDKKWRFRTVWKSSRIYFPQQYISEFSKIPMSLIWYENVV